MSTRAFFREAGARAISDAGVECLAETYRFVRRVRRDYESLQELCRKQREMLAQQRAFLEGHNPSPSWLYAAPADPPEVKPTNPRPEEEARAGE